MNVILNKGDAVLDDNKLKFIINYYTDTFPDVQFLFVNITNKGGGLVFDYYLSNVADTVAPDLYALIERHFNKLHLLDRYKDKAIQEFEEIKNSYLAEEFENEEQYDSFAAKQRKKCDLDVPDYGRNHWKVVLIRACADSVVFKEFILK